MTIIPLAKFNKAQNTLTAIDKPVIQSSEPSLPLIPAVDKQILSYIENEM